MSYRLASRVPPVIVGITLALAGFAVWAVFSLWPQRPAAAFRIREAWDTGQFWTVGVPLYGVLLTVGALGRWLGNTMRT